MGMSALSCLEKSVLHIYARLVTFSSVYLLVALRNCKLAKNSKLFIRKYIFGSRSDENARMIPY